MKDDEPLRDDRFADGITLMEALDEAVNRHTDLPELMPLTFGPDGLQATPWIFCKPLTALLMWVKVLPGRVEIRPKSLDGLDSTQIVARGKLGGLPVAFQVVTHRVDLMPISSTGLISRTDLAKLAAIETGAPDLGEVLDMETIRVPNAPVPPLDAEPQIAAAVP